MNLNKGSVLPVADPLLAGRGIKHLTSVISSNAESNWRVAIFVFTFQMRKLARGSWLRPARESLLLGFQEWCKLVVKHNHY